MTLGVGGEFPGDNPCGLGGGLQSTIIHTYIALRKHSHISVACYCALMLIDRNTFVVMVALITARRDEFIVGDVV